jgi:MFS family permease
MPKQQLLTLFFGNLVVWTVGNGLLPLLPIYGVRLGATPAQIGLYLAAIYFAMAVGTIAAGRLARRVNSYKTALLLVGVGSAPALGSIGQVQTFGQLIFTTAIVWFGGGMAMALLNIMTGLCADPRQRGKIFGLIYLAAPLGALIGGAVMGPLVDRVGYAATFALVMLFWLALPISIWLLLADRAVVESEADPRPTTGPTLQPGRFFYLILMVTVLAGVAVFTGRLGTSLLMKQLAFNAAAISSTTAAGGLVALPFVPLIGALSDRLGRKSFLVIIYIAAAAGVLVLRQSTLLWHFWLASALLSIAAYGTGSVTAAFATDVLTPAALNRGLSLFSATPWLGAIIGFAGTGYLIEQFGPSPVFIGAATLPVLAALLLQTIHPQPVTASIRVEPVRQG